MQREQKDKKIPKRDQGFHQWRPGDFRHRRRETQCVPRHLMSHNTTATHNSCSRTQDCVQFFLAQSNHFCDYLGISHCS